MTFLTTTGIIKIRISLKIMLAINTEVTIITIITTITTLQIYAYSDC
jgi:hypothetical protein